MKRLHTPIIIIRKLIIICGIISLWASIANASQSNVLNIYMIQNSGWMEPFFVDDTSDFKSLISSVIEKTNPASQELIIASFNQSVGNNKSPLLAYRGNSAPEIAKAVLGINLAIKPGRNAYADTDFQEAILGAITQYSPGTSCILWIFTNNKNSPQNSPETAVKNIEFYDWIQNEENIKRIVAYPYPMPVKGKRYQANGMMIYAMAYGQEADNKLEYLLAQAPPFEGRPARLKPLNSDAITFVPTSVVGNNISAALSDDNTLELQFDSSSSPEIATIQGNFTNNFFPYDIHAAKVSLTVKFFQKGLEGNNAAKFLTEISPVQLKEIPAGGKSDEVEIKIAIPPLPGMWEHPEIIFKSGYQIPATMEFILSDQELRLSPDFVSQMSKIFPGDPLPDIFVPGEASKHSVTSRSLLVKVMYPSWPLIVIAFILLVVLAGVIFLLKIFSGAKKYMVVVDGMQKTYMLKAFGSCTLYSARDEKIGSITRGLIKCKVQLDGNRTENVTVL